MEEESDNSIAFLDVRVERAPPSSLLCSERRHTPTTISTLNLTTTPGSREVSSSDLETAEKVCHVSKCLTEFIHLRNVFTANGYPDKPVRSNLPG